MHPKKASPFFSWVQGQKGRPVNGVENEVFIPTCTACRWGAGRSRTEHPSVLDRPTFSPRPMGLRSKTGKTKSVVPEKKGAIGWFF